MKITSLRCWLGAHRMERMLDGSNRLICVRCGRTLEPLEHPPVPLSAKPPKGFYTSAYDTDVAACVNSLEEMISNGSVSGGKAEVCARAARYLRDYWATGVYLKGL